MEIRAFAITAGVTQLDIHRLAGRGIAPEPVAVLLQHIRPDRTTFGAHVRPEGRAREQTTGRGDS